MKNILMIGNTHFDPVWTWEWEEAMYSIHSTLRSALDRLKEDDEFIYSFSSPVVFEWISKIDPEMLEEIKERVNEGRWDLNEGWWTQPDCYSACGESYARQSLYGQQYLKDTFGVHSKAIFNIDSFGHNSQSPQILKKSHMEYYCMCRPEKWFFDIDSPYFNWKGKDGTVIKAFRTGQFSDIYSKDMEKNIALAEENMKNATCDELMIYGVSNHGGAPTKKAIADIHKFSAQKDYDIKMCSVEDYFKAQDEPTVTLESEMITKNFGPYVNENRIKRLNRKAEYTLANAEKASVIAKKTLGISYDGEKLAACWKNLLFNHFHDILGGASHKEAYFDARNQIGGVLFTAEEIIHLKLAAVTKKIKTPGSNGKNPWNFVVWNLNDKPYNGYLEGELQWLHEFVGYSGGVRLEDENGNKFPCQIIMESSVIPEFRSKVLFKAEIPAMGYKMFKVIQTGEKVPEINKNSYIIETDSFKAEIDKKTGLIGSLYSKKLKKEFKDLITPQCFEDIADAECFNTNVYGKLLEPFALTDIETVEDGELRTVIKVSYKFRNSLLSLYYHFYKDAEYFDVKYYISWNEKHTVLKLGVKTDYNEAVVASPFANEVRPDSETDMPMGEWLCVHNETEGISFVSDSLFAYNKTGNNVGFSILRSCIFGEMTLGNERIEKDYPIMEQGIIEGGLRVVMHKGNCFENNIPEMARDYNNRPIVINEANHDGIYPAEKSFVAVDTDNVMLSAVKKAEKGCEDILRLCELAGKKQLVMLSYFGAEFKFEMNPYEIKTLKVADGKITEVYITED